MYIDNQLCNNVSLSCSNVDFNYIYRAVMSEAASCSLIVYVLLSFFLVSLVAYSGIGILLSVCLLCTFCGGKRDKPRRFLTRIPMPGVSGLC